MTDNLLSAKRKVFSPRPRRLVPFVLALLALGAQHAAAGPLPPAQRQAPAGTSLVYLPLLSKFQPLALNIIANPSFEDEHWYTDYPHGGNQWPAGWTFFSTEKDDLMPFPTKHQGGSTVEARSGGWGEYVHKYQRQLPPDEYLHANRGLIVDGQLTYKAFSDHIPWALAYSQTLHYTPGHSVTVSGYILGETSIPRCSASGILEDDHFIASLQFGGNADTRLSVQMLEHFDVPGNDRPWNKFQVTATFPPSGELPMKFIVQANWACEVNFFIDHFEAYDLTP